MKTLKPLLKSTALLAMLPMLMACGGRGEAFKQKRAEWQNSVVLINTFEVPKGKEAETLAMWQEAREFLKTQDGYLSTQLHQNLDPNGRFQFINVARWRTAEDFKKATENMQKALPNSRIQGVQATPSLYKVIEQDMPFPHKVK